MESTTHGLVCSVSPCVGPWVLPYIPVALAVYYLSEVLVGDDLDSERFTMSCLILLGVSSSHCPEWS